MGSLVQDQLNKCDGDVKMYELEDVKKHATADDCWVIHGKHVYDVTDFLPKHPGGADFILREAGNDITNVLRDEDVHLHTASAYNILKEYKIGEVNVQNDQEVDNNRDINSNELVGWKEEMVDWDKGMVFQVHKFGKEYIKWVHSPVNKSIKMFDNKFVEFFSNTPWYMIPIIWVPVVLYTAVLAYQQLDSKSQGSYQELDSKSQRSLIFINISALITTIFCFVAGICTWTLVEYTLHRYVFHLEPNGESPTQITLHFFFHGLHHKVPFDGGRLVFPPTVAAVFVILYWYVICLFCSESIRIAIFSGGVFGYICYDMIHYYIHHGNPSEGSYFHRLKKYHNVHHFEDSTNGFGISSKFWDIIFDTTLENRKLL